MSRSRSTRLFVTERLATGNGLTLTGDHAHYLGRVLRLRPGDTVYLFNGSGGQYPATITAQTRHEVTVSLGEFDPSELESPLELILIQGIARNERMDTIVQKATELGVNQIFPVSCERSQHIPSGKRASARRDRWQEIANQACQQSGRNRLPVIHDIEPLASILEQPHSGHCLILDPTSSAGMPSERPNLARIAVGPEGGFSDADLNLASMNGWQRVQLGPRILRTETAALAAISVMQFAFGDLAGSY